MCAHEKFGFRRETRSSRLLRGILTWAAICKGGERGGLGCVAFAFILRDAMFGFVLSTFFSTVQNAPQAVATRPLDAAGRHVVPEYCEAC